MSLQDKHINELFHKYLERNYTEQQLDELLHYFNLEKHDEQLQVLISQQLEQPAPHPADAVAFDKAIEQMDKVVLGKINPSVRSLGSKWWYAAASIFLVFSIGAFAYLYLRDNNPNSTLVSKYGDDVLPGKNKAYISLSDGSHYELKEDAEGLTIKDGNIQYTDGISIVSNLAVPSATIHTPNGGFYRLTLADGTKVILNSASSLTYPTQFNTERREVKLDGEAYFEVSKNLQKPFIVEGPQTRIEVLGTKFNATFYKNEQSATTLVEGKVRLHTDNGQEAILNPGDQAVYQNHKILIEQVYVQDYMSWINNQFVFNNASLVDVFAQLERWYDVQFDFSQELANRKIYAEFSRNRNLSEVLETLEAVINMKFIISGRRVIVRK